MQTINTNVFSENAQRQLFKTNNALQVSMQRLSSGLRINSAKDDAAGLQIVNRMTAEIKGMSVAIRNANDGISLAQTAEGAMQELTNALQRARELAVQASNGTYGENDRAALDAEYQALKSEMTRIIGAVEFNGQTLLDGNGGNSGTFTIAIDPSDGTGVDIETVDLADIANNLGDITGADNSNATGELSVLATSLQTVDTERAKMGAIQSRLTSAINNLANVRENLSASRSRIQDTDFAAETANLSKNQVMQQASTAILAQANAMPQNVLYLLGRG